MAIEDGTDLQSRDTGRMDTLKRPIVIASQRLVLHEMRIDDADYWFRFTNLESIRRYLPDRFDTVEHMRNTLSWLISNYDMDIESIIRITLAIHLERDESHPIGFVSFRPLPEDEGLREVAYAVHPEYWGIGIASEAGKVFINWIHGNLSDVPLYASVNASNVASIRVLSKLGFAQLHGEGENRLIADPKTLVFRLG